MIRFVFIIIVAVHGLIHLMGFLKAHRLLKLRELTLELSRPAGALWLLAALLFLCTASLLVLRSDRWWMVGLPALVLSQVLVILYWRDAKYGTVANLIVLAAVAIGYGAWSFNGMVRSELALFAVPATAENRMVTEQTLRGLPPVVRRWLRQSNVMGKNMIRNVHLKQKGELRTSPEGRWMPVSAEQWFTTDRPSFLWLAEVKAAPGISMDGRDSFFHGKGHMLIRVLKLLPVVDAEGPEIDQGAMLRYLAEILWFPTAAIHPSIQWHQVDDRTAEATMTMGERSVTGRFTFKEDGAPESFTARRYYFRKEGSTLEDWEIRLLPGEFREFSGIRIPAAATVTWKLRDGDFPWFRLENSWIGYDTGVPGQADR
ncbi:MAG: hypothetical protein JXA20_18885 [Spirochaetes bacterium]|nr:hypothetical protein [Spirochaetota bacterium]